MNNPNIIIPISMPDLKATINMVIIVNNKPMPKRINPTFSSVVYLSFII